MKHSFFCFTRRGVGGMALGIMLFCAPFVVNGGEVYRCVENGKTSISTSPCAPGAKSEQIATDQISKDSVQNARDDVARMREELDRLEQKYTAPRVQAVSIARPSWELWEEAPEAERTNYYYPVYEYHGGNLNAPIRQRDATRLLPGGGAHPGKVSGQSGKSLSNNGGRFASGHASAPRGSGGRGAHSGTARSGGGDGRGGYDTNTTP
ncbi:MAG: DUF4124 domain-containing protein [Zoogloeaceae bacterium]|nr:DUF4124 domain-containing protein [Zoogloeaceae bacterium]